MTPYLAPVQATSTDVYVAAFVARCDAMRRPGRREVDEPGVHGLLADIDDRLTRLLVTDDRAHDVLAALLPDTRAGMINVFAGATRCGELLDADPGWKSEASTAMVCRDLRIVPAVPLPSELTFRPVRRLAHDPPDGVPLQDAATAVMLADPRIEGPPDVFADYLRSLPAAIRLFAAVDADGVVRATSGSGAFGSEASVIFVNTEPGWRGRGVAQAMTAAALRAAQRSGARHAGLNASDAGLRIYLRLGFETVAPTTRFFRAADDQPSRPADERG